jgi:hypothetical protein
MKEGRFVEGENLPRETEDLDDAPTMGLAKNASTFISSRAKIQLTFKNITISAMPKARGCCKKGPKAEVMPSEF